MGPAMDADLRRRYLHALGVQLWRSRASDGDGPAAPLQPEVAAVPAEAGLVPADRVGTEPPQPEATEPQPRPRQAQAILDWETLEREVAGCRACGLCETRTQTVFGVGNRQAELMIVGEAPGADEDRAGEPFVGRAGQLLNLMLAAIGLRREQVFIANVLKCRPPGNRDPAPEEMQRCEPFLVQQIELVRPRLVLAVGRIAAQKLLRTGTALGQLRGQWFELGPDKTPLAVTYHPASLLRSPEQKSLVWQDLQRVARKLRELQNSPAGCGDGR